MNTKKYLFYKKLCCLVIQEAKLAAIALAAMYIWPSKILKFVFLAVSICFMADFIWLLFRFYDLVKGRRKNEY